MIPERAGKVQDSTMVGSAWLYTTLVQLFDGKSVGQVWSTITELNAVSCIVLIVSLIGAIYSIWRDESRQSVNKMEVVKWAKQMGYMTVKDLESEYAPHVKKALKKYIKKGNNNVC